jgi:hypothetical protein
MARRSRYQVEMLSELVYQSLADQFIVLVVAGIVPVVEQGTKHGTRLPPVVGRIEDARVAPKDMYAFVVDGGILGNELLGDLSRDIVDGSCTTVSVNSIRACD